MVFAPADEPSVDAETVGDEVGAALGEGVDDVWSNWVEGGAADGGDIRTSEAGDADTVCKLLVRAYAQVKDEEIQTRCLDVFDRVTELQIYGLHRVMAIYER